MPKRSKDKLLNIVVTCQKGKLAQTASELKRRGMKVHSSLEAIGVISGAVPSSKLARLAKTPGISIEREEKVQLPPPDAPVQ